MKKFTQSINESIHKELTMDEIRKMIDDLSNFKKEFLKINSNFPNLTGIELPFKIDGVNKWIGDSYESLYQKISDNIPNKENIEDRLVEFIDDKIIRSINIYDDPRTINGLIRDQDIWGYDPFDKKNSDTILAFISLKKTTLSKSYTNISNIYNRIENFYTIRKSSHKNMDSSGEGGVAMRTSVLYYLISSKK